MRINMLGKSVDFNVSKNRDVIHIHFVVGGLDDNVELFLTSLQFYDLRVAIQQYELNQEHI
jgi:hypothetical protein